MTTDAEAREIRDALNRVNAQDEQINQTQRDLDVTRAQLWFDGLPLTNSNDRSTSLVRFNEIENLLKTQTDRFRLFVLRQELSKANEDFKRFKRNG